MVYQTYLSADSEPNSQSVFRFTPTGLRDVGEFRGIAAARVFKASSERGLRLKIWSTWKVGWPDVYEWRDGAFRFADRSNPDLYRTDLGPYKSGEDYYPTWMNRAALADIRGQFGRARRLWTRAEDMCRSLEGQGRYEPFAGDTSANLAEIRRRLRWLRCHEYGHWLLYRPYDWGLEVPPYRLGHAENDDN